MADETKKYKIKRLVGIEDGVKQFEQLLPETSADQVTLGDSNVEVKLGAIDTSIASLESNKVDKVDGKSLVLDTEIAKLATVAEGAQVNVIETVKVDGAALTVDGKAVNIDLSGKVDKVEGKGLSTNDFDNDAKTKLEGIEAGAQVNVIEKVQVNGTDLTVSDKTVNVVIPAAAEYTIQKDEHNDLIYRLMKDGTQVGDAINIPKDLVVKSGSVITKGGKKYIELVLNDPAETKIDIEVDSLVDVYTSGTGVTVDATSREISVNRTTVDTWYDAAGTAEGLVSTEEARAKEAEEANAGAISAEETRAKAAEEANASAIATEKSRAEDAEKANADAITAEAERAAGAEGDLQDAITAEAERADAAEKANATAISNEVARAERVEAGLRTDVDAANAAVSAEETRAKAAEKANADAITAEAERATGVEEGLDTRIQALEAKSTNVKKSDNNGYIKVDDVDVLVYDDSALAGRVTTAESDIDALETAVAGIKIEGQSVTIGEDKIENIVSDAAYVHTDNNYDDAAVDKLAAISEGANKVEASTTNGNIKIDGTETTVYDDAALAGRVKTIEDKFTDKVEKGTYSVVSVNESGLVTAGAQIVAYSAAELESLAIGGLYFEEVK